MNEVTADDPNLSPTLTSKKWIIISISIAVILLVIFFLWLFLHKPNSSAIEEIDSDISEGSISQLILVSCNNQTTINQFMENSKSQGYEISSQDALDYCITTYLYYGFNYYNYSSDYPNENYTALCNKIANVDRRGQCLQTVSGQTLPVIKYYPLKLFNNMSAGMGNSGDILTTQPNKSGASYGSAWVAMPIMLPKYTRGFYFKAEFLGDLKAEGLLTVYINTQEIGTIDQRFPELYEDGYSFGIYTEDPMFSEIDTRESGPYTLSFRLDTFTETMSSIKITNISTMTVNAPSDY